MPPKKNANASNSNKSKKAEGGSEKGEKKGKNAVKVCPLFINNSIYMQ